MKKILAVALAALMAMTMMTSCAKKEDETVQVTLILKNLTNTAWQKTATGAQDAADEYGWELTILAPVESESNEEQLDEIAQSIAKGTDAIIIAPADSVGIIPGIESANDAGVPIFAVNTAIDTSDGTCFYETFVAVENFDASVSVAEYLAEAMNGEGDVIIIEGKAGAESSVDIVAGANSVFDQYDGIEVVASQSGQWARADAFTVAQNLLQAHPDVTAIFAANDEMAMGALEAVSQAGKEGEILIVGLDATDDAKAAVDAGTLLATCDKNNYGQGYMSMEAVKSYFENGNTIEPTVEVPAELYVKN